MARRPIQFAWCAAALAVVAGCVSLPLPVVDERLDAAAVAIGSTRAELERGRHWMVTSCTACHSAVQPIDYDAADWDEILPRMLKQAELDAVAGHEIRAYIDAVRLQARNHRDR